MKHIKDVAAICCTLVFLFLAAGSASKKYLSFNVELESIMVPSDSKVTYGEFKRVDATNSVSYADENIAIAWKVGDTNLNFTLKNCTNHTIKINWDDVTYVDISGWGYRVIHNNVRLVENDRLQPSLLIPAGISINESLTPTNNINYVSGKYGGWRVAPLIQAYYKNDKEIHSITMLYKGKTMGVLLPIEIDGVRNDYYYEFKVGNAKVSSTESKKKESQTTPTAVNDGNDETDSDMVGKEELAQIMRKVEIVKSNYIYTSSQHFKYIKQLEAIASNNPTRENVENLVTAIKPLILVESGNLEAKELEKDFKLTNSDEEKMDVFRKYGAML